MDEEDIHSRISLRAWRGGCLGPEHRRQWSDAARRLAFKLVQTASRDWKGHAELDERRRVSQLPASRPTRLPGHMAEFAAILV
jgi:hypothetical protein